MESVATATGSYTVRATFNLQKPSNHENFYGIIFGGSALEGPMQSYTYFTVSQMGKFLLKQRNGDMTPTLVAATQHAAVNRPDAGGQSSNTLEVRVMGDSVSYVVNNQVVHTMPKGTLKTDGIAGVRVNHVLDLPDRGVRDSSRSQDPKEKWRAGAGSRAADAFTVSTPS